VVNVKIIIIVFIDVDFEMCQLVLNLGSEK
jgi:hypothetical protein